MDWLHFIDYLVPTELIIWIFKRCSLYIICIFPICIFQLENLRFYKAQLGKLDARSKFSFLCIFFWHQFNVYPPGYAQIRVGIYWYNLFMAEWERRSNKYMIHSQMHISRLNFYSPSTSENENKHYFTWGNNNISAKSGRKPHPRYLSILKIGWT